MEFLQPTKKELEHLFNTFYLNTFYTLYDFIWDTAHEYISFQNTPQLPFGGFEPQKYNLKNMKHAELYKIFVNLFSNQNFIQALYEKLSLTPTAKYLYKTLIWEQEYLSTIEAVRVFGLNAQFFQLRDYERRREHLPEALSLIERVQYKDYRISEDNLTIDKKIKEVLKVAFPVPEDYLISNINTLQNCDFSYSNEEGIFEFIANIEGMLENNLVDFGATNEKPLAKTLTLLKNTIGINEFYEEDKKANTLATDMLTRSFYFYYYSHKRFRETPLETLKSFVLAQLKNKVPFFISRIFTSHLKKVRFDNYYTSQNELFELLGNLIKEIPKEGWISFLNIIKYCKYRNLRFDLESKHKTSEYFMSCDFIELENGEKSSGDFYVGSYYQELFFEPVLKGLFFYLSSLGIVEILYNKPISPYTISAKDVSYLSFWDQLEYVKFTDLGLYCLGFSKNYEPKKVTLKQTTLKFDNYKPIITIDKNDSIMLAKLEPYIEKYDEERYIISYSKVFRDCKDSYTLDLKIKNFYKIIQSEPPKVFKDLFDEILQNANLLSADYSKVVIDLKNNKKLLQLFTTNKKLQESIIKAQGFRILIAKQDMGKVSRIVKENGFFVEF